MHQCGQLESAQTDKLVDSRGQVFVTRTKVALLFKATILENTVQDRTLEDFVSLTVQEAEKDEIVHDDLSTLILKDTRFDTFSDP